MIRQNPVAVTMPPYSQYPTSGPPGSYSGGGAYGGGAYGGEGDGIALTIKFFPLAFMLMFFKPVVTVNGQPYQVPWSKRTVIPLPPGQYHLHVHVPYLIPTQVGKADLPINVGGGRPIELEYKAPLWAFSPGSLGSPPQKYNGVLATVLIMVIPLAILLICCCGSLFTSMFSSNS
jgi:hypothetical protein